MSRRDLLRASGVWFAALGLQLKPPRRPSLASRRDGKMIPLQQLDLDPEDLHERIPSIIDWIKHYRPQSNTRKRPWDPRDPDNRANEQLLVGHGKIVKASELSLAVPNTYYKARMILTGIRKLQAAADAGGIRDLLDDVLLISCQSHTFGFDHPDQGVVVPDGWKWEWTLTVPREVAERQIQAWVSAGYELRPSPAVKLAIEQVGKQHYPTGWMRARPDNRMAKQFSIMPDLRIPDCRAWIVERHLGVMAEAGVKRTSVPLKSGWLHGDASIRNTPAAPSTADPWLPSPYPGDSYRDASNALAVELAAAVGGGFWVTATNTGLNYVDKHLPKYVLSRHGGLKQLSAGAVLHGYWVTNLPLKKHIGAVAFGSQVSSS